MRSRSAQMVKEARQLAWPWTVLMMAGLAVLARPWFGEFPELRMSMRVWRNLTEWILPVGAFFGSSLLAALPLGAEFQYRTVALRFALPVERRQLWRQKILITVAAIVPTGLVYCLAIWSRYGRPFALMAASWIVVTTAGSLFFTMLARSTMGGMVLSMVGSCGITAAWIYYEKYGHIPTAILVAMCVVLTTYVGAMVWLGRRMILRFQAQDGMQAGEAFVPGERVVPRLVTEWLRCRRTQPLANLVRREFRLLRALWPLSVFNVVAWILLVAFNQLPNQRPDSLHASFVLTVILGVLIAVLAGTLSLGEEKTWGTHEWHMTAPISISLQWAVKLLFAVFTSLTLAALVPIAVVMVGGWISAPVEPFLTGKLAAAWMVEAAAVALIAFWCACVVKSTVHATLWVFPLCAAIVFADEAGSWVISSLHQPLRKLLSLAISWFDPMAVARAAWQMYTMVGFENLLVLAVAPLLAVGLIQSHRFFRAQISANRLRVVQCAVPLMMVSFLCSIVGGVWVNVLSESFRQRQAILHETDHAIVSLQRRDAAADGVKPRKLSPDELATAAPLSDGTQRWLRNANITVGPAPEWNPKGPGAYFPGRMTMIVPAAKLAGRVPYSAVVRRANGSGCSILFQIRKEGPVGYLTAICE